MTALMPGLFDASKSASSAPLEPPDDKNAARANVRMVVHPRQRSIEILQWNHLQGWGEALVPKIGHGENGPTVRGAENQAGVRFGLPPSEPPRRRMPGLGMEEVTQ